MKHKHHDLIVAWANGAEIQFSKVDGPNGWISVSTPRWTLSGYYRIKPEPKPDYVRYGMVRTWRASPCLLDSVKATFDGETGYIKTLEKI